MKTYVPSGDFIRQSAGPISRVIAGVGKTAGVTPAEIVGPLRESHIVRARFAAMAICRDYLALSYPAIGRAFNRDHSTVINAMRRVDAVCNGTDLDDFEEIARRAGLVKD